MIQLLHKSNYEVFEIHTTNRDLFILTLRVTKKDAEQVCNNRRRKIPVGSLTTIISKTKNIPEYANFLRTTWIGFNKYRHWITKSFKTIHIDVKDKKDALNHIGLRIWVEGEEVYPFLTGKRYGDKGIYIGVDEDAKGKYYKFANHKEYFK